MDRHPAGRAYFRSQEAANLLSVSPKTVDRWANFSHIPCTVTVGGHRFRADEVPAVASSMGLVDTKEPDHRP
jgi:predicted site-specific integrase-resolvase